MNSCSLGEELQKNKDMVKSLEGLGALRQWMATQSHLPILEKNDLVLFWHRNKYDLFKSKENIDSYFWMRFNMPAYFSDRNPNADSLAEILSTVCIITLPDRTPDGYAVVLFRLLNPNPARFDFCQAVKYLNMVIDFHVYLEGTSNGYLFVCDLKGTSPAHVASVPKKNLVKYFEYLKKGAHFRWKGMHFINSSAKCGYMNEFVKRKIIDVQGGKNVFLHTDIASLSKMIPREILPDEMGGRGGNINELHQAQIKKMKDYSAWFKVEERIRLKKETIGVDEKELDGMNPVRNNGNSIL